VTVPEQEDDGHEGTLYAAATRAVRAVRGLER